MTEYVIQGGASGKARLGIIARALRSSTLSLLERVGLGEGMVCLDLGCGGGDVTLEMARLVGPGGRAVGIDVDEVKLTMARGEAKSQGLENIEFAAVDVCAWERDAVFDIVYARFLLTHLPDPADVLCRMAKSTRVGGVVVVEDIDYSGIFSYPRCPALERHISLYRHVVHRRGGDPDIGPRLRELFVGAGFTNVAHHLVQPVMTAGDAKFIYSITTQSIADVLVGDGIATREEIDNLIDELDAFAHDPNTLISFPRVFQLWGQQPEGSR